MLYLVSYDISDTEKRKKVTEKLDGMKSKFALESQWLIFEANTNAEKLFDEFHDMIDEETDSLFVNSLNPSSPNIAWHTPKSGLRTFLISCGIREIKKGT